VCICQTLSTDIVFAAYHEIRVYLSDLVNTQLTLCLLRTVV